MTDNHSNISHMHIKHRVGSTNIRTRKHNQKSLYKKKIKFYLLNLKLIQLRSLPFRWHNLLFVVVVLI